MTRQEDNDMRLLRWLALLLAVGYLLTGMTPIRPGERAVVRRFGRMLETKPEPGLWIGLPWGLDAVDRVAVDRLRPVTIGYTQDEEGNDAVTPPGQLLTGDHNLVNVRVVLNYTIRADEVEKYVVQADQADALIARAAEAAL